MMHVYKAETGAGDPEISMDALVDPATRGMGAGHPYQLPSIIHPISLVRPGLEYIKSHGKHQQTRMS